MRGERKLQDVIEMTYNTAEELRAAFPAYYAREAEENSAAIWQYTDGWEG